MTSNIIIHKNHETIQAIEHAKFIPTPKFLSVSNVRECRMTEWQSIQAAFAEAS